MVDTTRISTNAIERGSKSFLEYCSSVKFKQRLLSVDADPGMYMEVAWHYTLKKR